MPFQQLRALLVEDREPEHSPVRDLLTRVNRGNIVVECATDSHAAIRALRCVQFDILVTTPTPLADDTVALLDWVAGNGPRIPTIVLTDDGLYGATLCDNRACTLLSPDCLTSTALEQAIHNALATPLVPNDATHAPNEWDAERFKALVQHGIESVSVLDRNGVTLYQSGAIRRSLGFSVNSNGDKDILSLVHPEDRATVEQALQDSIDRPDLRASAVYRFLLPDGSWRWMESTTTNLLHDPVVGGIVVITRDVTEQKQRERADRLLSAASATLGSTLDYEETLQRVTRLAVPEFADWCSVTLLDDENVPRRLALTHADPERQRQADEYLGAPFVYEPLWGIPLVLKTGQTDYMPSIPESIWFENISDEQQDGLRALGLASWVIAPLILHGKVIGAIAFMYGTSGNRYSPEDVQVAEEIARRATIAIENARLHEQARAAERRLRSVVEQVPAAMFMEKVGEGLVYVSPQIERMIGYTPEELLAQPQTWHALTNPDRRPVLAGRSFYQAEVHYTTRDGRTIWVQSDATLQYDESGQPEYWQGFLTDITAQKQADDRFRALVQHATDGVTILGQDGVVIYQSDSVRRVLGYEADQLTGVNVFGLIHPEDIDSVAAAFADLLAQPDAHPKVTFRFLHGDGTWRWMESSASNLLHEPTVEGIVVTTRDITERKEAEAGIAQLASVASSIADAVIATDSSGHITAWNAGAERLYGYSQDDALGASIAIIALPDRAEEIRFIRKRILAGERSLHIETERRHKDGSAVAVAMTISPIRNATGQIVGTSSISHDISGRKTLEARQQLLATVSDILSNTLNVAETLERLAQLVVPAFADWCTVNILDAENMPRRLASAHANPEKQALLAQLARYPLDLSTNLGMASVIRSGVPALYTDVPEEFWENLQDPEYIELHRQLGMHSTVSVPLIARGRILGAIGFATGDSGRQYHDSDLAFALEIARRAATAIDNAQLYQTSRTAEEEYRALIEQMPAVMYRGPLGDSTIQPYLSPRIEQLLGYTVEEWLSSRDLRRAALHPDDRERAEDDFERRDTTLAASETEYRYITKGGETIWVHNTARIVRDEDGKPLFWQGFLTDITGRKTAEADRRKSDERLRSVVDHSPIGIVTLNSDGQILTVNQAFQRMIGYTEAELFGRSPSSILVTVDRVEVPAKFAKLVAGEIDRYSMERQYACKDGKRVWGRVTVSAVRDANGAFLHSISMIEDISEQRQAEQALRQSEEQFRNAFEDAATGLVFVDFKGTILRANRTFCELLGYDEATVVGRKALDFTHPEDAEVSRDAATRVRSGASRVTSYTKRYIHRDGHVVWVNLTASVIHDDDGLPLHYITQVQDITEQKRAESALRESEARFRGTFDDAAIGMAIFALDRTIESVNPAFCRMFDYEPQDFFGRSAAWFSHPEDTDIVGPLLKRLLAGEIDSYQAEKRYVRRDGAIIWCSVSSAAVRDDHGEPRYMVSQFQDITERKLAEDERRRSDQRYRAVYEHAPIGIVTVDPDGDVITANRAFERMIGYSEAELRAMQFRHLMPAEEHPDSRVRFKRLVAGLMDYYSMDKHYIRKSGELMLARLSISAVRDDEGRFLHSISMIEDVTEARDAEEALRRSEHRYRSMVQNATDITTVMASDWTILYESPSLSAILGYDPETIVGTHGAQYIHPDDLQTAVQEMQIAIDDPSQTVSLAFRVRHMNGSWRWLECVGRNLLDDPAIAGIVINARDVTDRKRYEASQKLLADASTALSTSLDLDVTLKRIAHLSVPTFADWCVVSIRATDGTLRRVAVVHADPEKQPIADVLVHHPPSDQQTRSGIPHVVKTGRAVINRSFALDHWDQDDPGGQYPILKQLGVTSSVVVPLIVRGESIGAIAFMYGDSGRAYDDDDLKLAEELARRASTAVKNAQLHREVTEAETRFRSLIQHSSDMITILDSDYVIRYKSPAGQRVLGYAPDELVGRPSREILHPDEFSAIERCLDGVREQSGVNVPLIYRCRHKDGSWRWIEAMLTNLLDEPGIQGIVINGRDITERRAAEEAIRDSEARFRSAFDDAAIGMAIVGTGRRLMSVNPALCMMLGYDEAELIGMTGRELSHPDDADALTQYVGDVDRGAIESFKVEQRYLHKDGSSIWCVISSAVVRDEHGTPQYYLSQFQDITERKELELQMSHQALHDSLTGLPNRTLLMDRIDQVTSAARRHGGTVAVLFLDIDNFKLINDSLGHAVGDQALVGISQRLRQCIRSEDTVARFGGDEFVIVLGHIQQPLEAIEVAQRVLTTFDLPLQVQDRDVIMSPSIGIALSERGQHGRDELLRHADIAMYRAKNAGKSSYHLFDAAMQGEALQRLELEYDLRHALERDQLSLVFQPIVSFASGRIVGAEALLRWNHPTRGQVSPDSFIPVAEETGLIVPIGDWVLREACAQAAKWQSIGQQLDGVRVSVNLSARQFRDPRIAEQVGSALALAQLPSHLLMLELTESDVMENANEAVLRLNQLRDLGVTLAIDDFGTGYSSLAYLHVYPVDVLKIDRAFVSRIGHQQDSTPLVAGTIRLAQALGMKTVAEGIETEAQLLVVQREGCTLGQGYYFARPLSDADLLIALEQDERSSTLQRVTAAGLGSWHKRKPASAS